MTSSDRQHGSDVHDRDGAVLYLVEHAVAIKAQSPVWRAAKRGGLARTGIAREQRYRA